MKYLGNIISYLLGGIDTPIIVLLIIMFYVYLTGWCKAIYYRKMNKLVGLKGLVRDIGYLLIVSLASMLDNLMGSSEAIRTIIIYFFVAREGMVLLKHWSKMGLPLPEKIYQVLENLIGEEDSDGNST